MSEELNWFDNDDGGAIGGGGDPVTPTPPPTPPPAPSGTPTPVPTPPPPNPSTAPAIVSSSAAAGGSIAVERIPLVAAPAQVTTVQLGAQQARVAVYQKRTGLFLDLFVNDVRILSGALCLDRIWLLRDAYLGFVGDLAFVDTQGSADPSYLGLADRFQLVWGHGV